MLAGLPLLSKAVGAEEIGFSIDLGSNRMASVSSFKGSLGVDLREHYEKDGHLAPGKADFWIPGINMCQASVFGQQHLRGGLAYNTCHRATPDLMLTVLGKKGILLPLEQWEALCRAASEISSAAGSSSQSPVKSPVKASPGNFKMFLGLLWGLKDQSSPKHLIVVPLLGSLQVMCQHNNL